MEGDRRRKKRGPIALPPPPAFPFSLFPFSPRFTPLFVGFLRVAGEQKNVRRGGGGGGAGGNYLSVIYLFIYIYIYIYIYLFIYLFF